MKKTEVNIDYALQIPELGLQIFETPVKLSDKEIQELIDFVRTHPTGEFEDIPSALYDKAVTAIQESAIREAKKLGHPLEDFDQLMPPQYLPEDLVSLLPEDVLQLLPAEFFSDEDDEETDEDEAEEMPAPAKDNTLYLTIKQTYFDQILRGEKTIEYRDIKPTTYKKYLLCDGDEPYYNPDLVTETTFQSLAAPLDMLFLHNDGNCILIPNTDICYLNLAVGYQKQRDTALVQVVDYSFHPTRDPKTGEVIRFSFDREGLPVPDPNGPFCYWIIAFHLGQVIDLHKKD